MAELARPTAERPIEAATRTAQVIEDDPPGPIGPRSIDSSAVRTADRRSTYRRAADRHAHDRAALLGDAVELLGLDLATEARLARVLERLATIAGALRSAALIGGPERLVIVGRAPGESDADAERFARWLDVAAPRSRAERAASSVARIEVVGREADADEPRITRARSSPEETVRLVAVREAGAEALAFGFAFVSDLDADEFVERVPASLVDQAALVLGLVLTRAAEEREVDRLRARDVERARFVSTVAHDLRTPLTGLAGYLDLILDGKVPDREVEREFLERGRHIVEDMGSLVGDLLEVSRIDSGNLALDIRPFSVADACQRVLEALDPIAFDRRITLSRSLPPRIRTSLGDRRRVEQILTNLLANALKFSPSDSAVELTARTDGGVVTIAVRDEGRGIPLDDRAHIFERFYRMAGHERVTGTGLGLPIARDLARSMGGDLGVASVVGSGSSFVLVLPGPTQIEGNAVEDTLEHALITEEIAIEERSVVRAVRSGWRRSSSPVRADEPPGHPG